MFHRIKINVILVLALYFSVSSVSLAVLVTNPPQAITHTVSVQPIIVSDDGGANTATFFGNATQQLFIENFVDDIWAQVGIDVNFLSANTWNDSFANNGTSLPRPTSDLNTVVNSGSSAGVSNPNPNIINMFFVNVAAGFGTLGLNNAAGLAFVDGNGVTQYVGSNLLSFSGGREVIASVVAHEIGHNLGLLHSNSFGFPEGTENLMFSGGGNGERLNATQMSTVLGSNLSVAVIPIPPAIWLFGSALLTLFSVKRRTGLVVA